MAIEILYTVNIDGTDETLTLGSSVVANAIIDNYNDAEISPSSSEAYNLIWNSSWSNTDLFHCKRSWNTIANPTYALHDIGGSDFYIGFDTEDFTCRWAGGLTVSSGMPNRESVINIPVFAIDTTNETAVCYMIIAYNNGAQNGITCKRLASASNVQYNALVPTVISGGGAGSGYIGNSLLSNKKMVGYNVPTSSSADTKTESVNVYSANAESNKAKSGNGHARIKLIDEYGGIEDLRTWTKNQSDSVIHITKNGDEETVVINPVVDWEHIVYEATVEKNTSYSFIYDAKCTSGSRSYTANQMAAYILSSNPGSDANWFHYSIISENGGSLNNLGDSYQTFTTTFNSGNRTKVWIAINYSAISDSEHDVTFVYKNVRLV